MLVHFSQQTRLLPTMVLMMYLLQNPQKEEKEDSLLLVSWAGVEDVQESLHPLHHLLRNLQRNQQRNTESVATQSLAPAQDVDVEDVVAMESVAIMEGVAIAIVMESMVTAATLLKERDTVISDTARVGASVTQSTTTAPQNPTCLAGSKTAPQIP